MNENGKTRRITIVLAVIITLAIICGVVAVAINLKNKENIVNEGDNTQNQQNAQTTEVKLGSGNTDLSLEFIKMNNQKENVIYSPLSVKYALKMLSDGANGNTKKQIEDVLGDNGVVKYENIEDVLSLANALYIKDEYSKSINEEYKNDLINKYNAEIKYDAFKDANNINSWIEEKTFGQIKNMLTNDAVNNEENKMMLINALAVNMAWKDKFDEEDTASGKFSLINGNEMNATMMHKETKSENLSYYKNDNITAITMDLEENKNGQMEFLAIMPNEDLSKYISTVSAKDFENIDKNLKKASETENGVSVSIPRFSFDFELDLVKELKTLGITDAFDEKLADFSKMSSANSMYVNDVLHKANIDFTEKGIKASAATVISLTDGITGDNENKSIELKFDRPFMYVIRDKKTNEIWFVGTVYQPNSWESNKADYIYK